MKLNFRKSLVVLVALAILLSSSGLSMAYYNPTTGRFSRMDPYTGQKAKPQSLHKYVYCWNDPVNRIDPSGEFSLTEITVSMAINSLMMDIGMPVIAPIANKAAGRLLPVGLTNTIMNKVTPSAIVGGISGQARFVGYGVLGGGYVGNAEVLWSPRTHNTAFYTAQGWTGGLGGYGVSGSVYGGLVYGASRSSMYEGPFTTFTIPLRAVPTRLYGKIQTDIASMMTRHLIIRTPTGLDTEMWMRANRAIHDSARRMSRVLKNSSQAEINLFIDNARQVGGFSLGVSGGIATRPCNSFSISHTWYTQAWPSYPVPFE